MSEKNQQTANNARIEEIFKKRFMKKQKTKEKDWKVCRQIKNQKKRFDCMQTLIHLNSLAKYPSSITAKNRLRGANTNAERAAALLEINEEYKKRKEEQDKRNKILAASQAIAHQSQLAASNPTEPILYDGGRRLTRSKRHAAGTRRKSRQ